MANVMQTNIDQLRLMLEERRGYAGVDALADWMRSDACDWADWPKVMREALCKVPVDFRDFLAGPMSMAMQDIMLGRKIGKDTVASLRNRMKRCAWGC
jgi:hypothetical protein